MAQIKKENESFVFPFSIFKRKDLIASDKLVYGVLFTRIGINGETWPGFKRIAQDIGRSEKTIRRAVQKLEARNLITVEFSEHDRQRIKKVGVNQ